MAEPSIFKAYDIRGVYGEELDEGIAYLIGRAVASHINASAILVGHDMRVSSQPLKEALLRGIMDQGSDAVEMGLCSTPFFYWTTQRYAAGVMVTASHNPAKYNGFKICRDGAVPVGRGSGMEEIERRVLEQDFPPPTRKGASSTVALLDDFLRFNLSFLKTTRQFTVVIDAANGMGGYTYGELLKRLPPNITIIPMYFEPDGTFPNHEANPLKEETLVALQARVVAEHADLGVATDGDEDRIVFVDENGSILRSDITHALLARQVLAERPGGVVLYSVNESWLVPEEILAAGGKPVMGRIGHAFAKLAMREHSAVFGGEVSGHFFNPEQQNTENTQVILFRMLNLLGAAGEPLSEVARPLRERYAKIPETNFTVQDAPALIERFDAEYAPKAKAVSRIDGVRIDFDDWWFNLRASNTEPLLRLNMEARTPALLDEKFNELKGKIG
jgi:phosphomannomutase